MNLKNLPAGDNLPNEINVVIEIPAQDQIKYELDEETGALFVDRFLHTASAYPFNYGFVPSSHAEDGDPLDVIVLSEYPIVPMAAIKCKPLAILDMEDESGKDEKIVAVPLEKIDPVYGAYNSADDIPAATKDKIKHFFETYKALEPNKWVKVKDWSGVEEAKKVIEKSCK